MRQKLVFFRVSEVPADPDLRCRIHYSGAIVLTFPFLYKAPCTMNVKLFPFDKQECTFLLGANTIYTSDLFFSVPSANVGTQNLIPNPDFKLEGVIQYIYNETSEYLEGPETFSNVCLKLNIARIPKYYIIHLVVPSIAISCLAVLGLFFPFQPLTRGPKIKLGITTLLSMSMLLMGVVDTLPKVSIQAMDETQQEGEMSLSQLPLFGKRSFN